MRPPLNRPKGQGAAVFWDLLTFEHLMTNQVIHLIYWAGLAIIALLLSLIAGTLFTGMVVELVADIQDGRRDHSPGELLRSATPVIGQLLLVGIVAAIGIVIGFFLIIVPGLILLTIWSVAAPVVVLLMSLFMGLFMARIPARRFRRVAGRRNRRVCAASICAPDR